MHALYLRYNNQIFAFAMSRVRNAELASDCVHDTMIEVWRVAKSFEGRSAVKTWLFSISRNKLIDAVRKQGKMSYVDEFPEQEDTEPNPEEAAIAASQRALLHHCLEGLSGSHRVAIRLTFLEELTYPEVADIEGVPVGTIKTRVHHAKKALMRCLERCAGKVKG